MQNITKKMIPCGVHAGGYRAFCKSNRWRERLREKQERLNRRIDAFCQSESLVGSWRVFRVRRKWMKRLRRRMDPGGFLFLGIFRGREMP